MTYYTGVQNENNGKIRIELRIGQLGEPKGIQAEGNMPVTYSGVDKSVKDVGVSDV